MSHDTTLSSFFARPAGSASLAQRLRALVEPLRRQALQRSAARDTAAVREMASRLQLSDPSLASDLLAAADRHERQFESRR